MSAKEMLRERGVKERATLHKGAQTCSFTSGPGFDQSSYGYGYTDRGCLRRKCITRWLLIEIFPINLPPRGIVLAHITGVKGVSSTN